jgi:tetratricopeptide (TPR) repeat protein
MTVEMTADDIQKVYAEGLKQQNAGQFDAAIKTYGQIIAANPRVAEAHFQIGRCLTSINKFDIALRHLKEAVRLRPQETAVWLAWSDAVALGGEPRDEEEIIRVVKSAPVDSGFKIVLQDRYGAHRKSTRPKLGGAGKAEIARLVGLMGAGKFAEAETAAYSLLKTFPESAIAWNILGSAQSKLGKMAAAEQSFQKTVKLDPGYAEAHENFGRMMLDQKRDEDAIAHFRRAVCIAPGLPTALVVVATFFTRNGLPQLALRLLNRVTGPAAESQPYYLAAGNAHTKLKNYRKAEELFTKALALTPKTVDGRPVKKGSEALGLLAQAQARQGKDELALANFRRALEQDPDSAVATVGLASLLQTLGKFDEAVPLFHRGFELDPTNGENYRLFIAAHKTKAGDPIIDQMIGLHSKTQPSSNERMAFCFAIAKALEDIKDYERVFTYLDEANAIIHRNSPFDMDARYREVESTKAFFEGVDWKRPQAVGATDFAPIFVTGMPRSGTTLIEQIISSHSMVEGAGEVGEGTRLANAFVQDNRKFTLATDESLADLGRKFADYLGAMFPDATHITDKSIQTYMYIGLLKLALPNARFVVVRRDPRDTLLSIYKNKFPDDTHLYAYDQRDLARFYETFLDMVGFWRDLVPDWFYEVDYDALVADPEPETRKLIEACGLPWEDACLSPQDNDRKVETLSLFQVRQPITKSSVKGWKRFEKDLAPMLDELRKRGLVSD